MTPKQRILAWHYAYEATVRNGFTSQLAEQFADTYVTMREQELEAIQELRESLAKRHQDEKPLYDRLGDS